MGVHNMIVGEATVENKSDAELAKDLLNANEVVAQELGHSKAEENKEL